MGESRPPVLALDWDEWTHPGRAIAAIWLSTRLYIVLFVLSLPLISDSAVGPVIGTGFGVLLGSAVPLIAVYVAARFD